MLQLSSVQAYSTENSLVPNVPRMKSPIAQDLAARSRGQGSDSSLFQRSGKKKVENCPESPWLARELERFYGNDLYDVLRSPVQERSLREDVIRQAKTELKHHDSAINKHLVKKAALEGKSKSWVLDSGVTSDLVDSDEGAADPFQTEPAIEKRIRELDEASKRQDLAIQKHNVKKDFLERGIKRHLDYEPLRPSKKTPSKAAQEKNIEENTYESFSEEPLASLTGAHSLSRLISATPFSHNRRSQAEHEGYHSIMKSTSTNDNQFPSIGRAQGFPDIAQSFDQSPSTAGSSDLLEETPPAFESHSLENSSSSATKPHHRVRATRDSYTPPINSQSLERHEVKKSSNQAMSGDTVQEFKQQTPFVQDTIPQPFEQQHDAYASEGPASSGRSLTHWLLRRRPSSFGSVMDGMFKKFERVAIGVWPARKSRDRRAVPVEDSTKT